MKAEALEETDRCRKHQSSDKGKREVTIVDLPFVLIIRAKKARQEQDGCPCSNDGQNEERRTERQNPAFKPDSDDGEKCGDIKQYERGSAPDGEFVSKGLMGQSGPPREHRR